MFLVLLIFSEAQGQSLWSQFSNTGFIARYGATSTLVNDKIYVIGGEGKDWLLNDIQVYDPSVDSWSTVAAQGDFTRHFSHSAVEVGGKIYVIGGVENNIDFADSIWVFDPSNNEWSVVLPLEGTHFTDRYNVACSAIGDNIYMIGGNAGPLWFVSTVEVFNLNSRIWSTPQVTNDSFHILITPKSFVIDGKIYVVGYPLDPSCHCDVQVYDPQTNVWSIPLTNGMKTPRQYFAANEINGKIYIMGGEKDGGGDISTTEVYDPQSRTWSLFPTDGTFTARYYLGSNVIGNKIFTMDGQQAQTTYLSTTEVLTIGSNTVVDAGGGKLSYNHRIYPDPASNILNLVSGETPSKFQIIDIMGRVVLSGMTLDHATLSIDISTLAKGIYYVLVNNPWGYPVEAGKVAIIGK